MALYNSLNNTSIIDRLPSLNEDLDFFNNIECLNLKENNRLNCYIVSLEELTNFSNENGLFIEEVLNELVNLIDVDNIAFSCLPSSLLFDNEIRFLKESLNYNNIAVYVINESLSEDALILNEMIEYCLKNEDVSLLEESEAEKKFDSEYFMNLARSGASHTMKSATTGFEKGLKKTVKNVFDAQLGRFLDTKDSDGQIVKNGKISNHMRNLGVDNQMAIDTAKNLVGETRDQLLDDATDALFDKGKAFIANIKNRNPEEGKRLANAIGGKIDTLEHRMEQAPPQRRGLFGRIIDALKRLLRKIKEYLFG